MHPDIVNRGDYYIQGLQNTIVDIRLKAEAHAFPSHSQYRASQVTINATGELELALAQNNTPSQGKLQGMSAFWLFFSAITLDGYPDEHDDNVQTLALATVILVGPHAVLLFVPVRASRAMHSSSTDMGLAISSSGFGAGRNVRLLGLSLSASAGLIEGGRGDEVLDDRAVASKLERGSRGTLRSRLGNNGLQDRVDNGRVPLLSLSVVIEFSIANGTVASIGRDLLEAVEGDGRSSGSHFECC